MKRSGLGNRLLSNRRVDRQHDLLRLHGRSNPLHLVHQVPLIPVSSGSIDNDQVGLLLPVVFETMLRYVLGLLGARLAVDRNLHFGRQLLQLLQRARTVSISSNNTHSKTPFLEEPCELHRASRLTSALDPNEHELAKCTRLDLDLSWVLTDKLCHFFVEDFDNMLTSGYTRRNARLQRTIFDSLGELENKFDVHIGLE